MFKVLQQKYMKKTYQNMTFQEIRKLTRPAGTHFPKEFLILMLIPSFDNNTYLKWVNEVKKKDENIDWGDMV